MGVIADLVLKVKADTSGIQKDIKKQLTKTGANIPVGSTGGAEAGAGGAGMAAGAGSLAVVGVTLMAIYGVVKKIALPAIQHSQGISLIADILKNSVGVAMDLVIFSILMGIKTVSPLVDMVQGFVSEIMPIFKGMYSDIVGAISPYFSIITDSLSGLFKTGLDRIINGFSLLGGIIKVFAPLFALFMTLNFSIINSVMSIMSSVGGILISILRPLLYPLLVAMLPILGPSLLAWAATALLLSLMAPVFDQIEAAIKVVSDWTVGFFKGIAEALGRFFVMIYNKIADQAPFLKRIDTSTAKIALYTYDEAKDLIARNKLEQGMRGGKTGIDWKLVENLHNAGLTWAEILASATEYREQRHAESAASKYGLSTDGSGGLVIPQDYWADAYDGANSGRHM